jgi:FMN phosphatase YigB (HAD superfamily)
MIGNSLAHDKVAAEAAGIDFFWIDETSVDRQQI